MFLPPEILIEIFLLSLPPTSFAQATRRTTLALVCRCWNDIIQATPVLWSRISIADTTSNVKRSLVKSAESPIDVYGVCSHSKSHQAFDHYDSCHRFFREIRCHTERWRRVELLVVDARRVVLAPTHSPFLESLKLCSTSRPIDDDGYRPLVTSARAPQLRKLFLEGHNFVQWDVLFPPTLSHLVLQKIYISSRQILTGLAASPNLTVLRLSQLYVSDEGVSHDSTLVELASLREMAFNRSANDLVREVMAGLKFPSECKVWLEYRIPGRNMASFLAPALSRCREACQRVGEIIQVRILVLYSQFRVFLQCLHWDIRLSLSNPFAVRDTLEWFGISTKESAAASYLANSPLDSMQPLSNIPITLEFDHSTPVASLEYLTPVFDIGCINKINFFWLTSGKSKDILFYLLEPRLPTQPAMTTTAGQEPVEDNGVTIQNVTETWPLRGLCELALGMPGDDVLKTVTEFVERRSSSRVGIDHHRTAPLRQSATPPPARVKRVEFGGKDDTFSGNEFHRSIPGSVEAWPSALLDLLDILDEDAQVFWLGRRISRAGIMD